MKCEAENRGADKKSVHEKNRILEPGTPRVYSLLLRQQIGGFIFEELECLHTPFTTPYF